MSRSYFSLLALSVGLVMSAGCEDVQSNTTTPANPPPAPSAQPEIGAPAPAVVVPPPGTVVAPPAGGGPAAQPPADPKGPLQNLVRVGDIYFYDKDDNFMPKDAVDLLQRAVQSYMDTRKYKADDSAEWPMITDLSMLVQYKVIRALPAPPPGQKFVLDPATRKVSLAAN
ncbi:MAG: hypothetical protein K0Q55_467 [Verrucomicrobia bacterium]|nr:hypothetical protein [Verrucomicrobiota bacterium]